MTAAATAGPRNLMLDVVRAWAIVAVLAFHFRAPTGVAMLDAIMRPLGTIGWAGVDLFFVLSGYLIGTMILRELAATGRLDVGRFIWRRALRLWPVVWLFLAVLLAIDPASGWPMTWPVLLHIQNYVVGPPAHLWSLAVEEQFYLAAAFLLPACWRHYGTRGVAVALTALIAAVVVGRAWHVMQGVELRHVQWRTPYRIDALSAGVLIAAARIGWRARFDAVARHRLVLTLTGVACFAGLLAFPLETPGRYTVGLVLAMAGSAAWVIAAADAHGPHWGAAVVRPFASIALIAYPLYVWHGNVGHLIGEALAARGLTDPLPVMMARWAASFAVAVVVHALVERPIMAWRDRGRACSEQALAA